MASKDAREGKAEAEEALEGRGTYFFFVDFFAFFTVFLAFGAEAFAARFAFAIVITRTGLCEEIHTRREARRPQGRWVYLWLTGGRAAEESGQIFPTD